MNITKCEDHSYCSTYDELFTAGECANCGCSPDKHQQGTTCMTILSSKKGSPSLYVSPKMLILCVHSAAPVSARTAGADVTVDPAHDGVYGF